MKYKARIFAATLLCSCTLVLSAYRTAPEKSIPKRRWQQSLLRDTTTFCPVDSIPEMGGILVEGTKMSWRLYGQCDIIFDLTIQGDYIIATWNGDRDCIYNLPSNQSMLHRPFAKIGRENDSTLSVAYYFPKWVAQQNAIFNDAPPAFSRRLHLVRPTTMISAEEIEYNIYRQLMLKKYGDTFNDARYWYGYEMGDMTFPYDDSLKRIEVLKHLNDK